MDTTTKKQRKAKRAEKIKTLIAEVEHIITEARQEEKRFEKQLSKVHPEHLKSAINLIHYRSLRLHDISTLQKRLGNIGLSRLENPQISVLASLKATRSILKAFLGKTPEGIRSRLSFKKAKRLGRKRVKALLGYRSKGRHTRIMVTIPSIAAEDYELVENMIANGMNCARINCAHDNEAVWLKMIANIRKASKKLQKKCKVAMDLGGPKIRTGALEPGPKVIKIRPKKDNRGKVIEELVFMMGEKVDNDLAFVPLLNKSGVQLGSGTKLYFLDARLKKRKLKVIKHKENYLKVSVKKTAYFETGMALYFDKERKGEYLTVGDLPNLEVPIILNTGDELRIDRKKIVGANAQFDTAGIKTKIAHISCTAPEVFDEVQIGEPIRFDDGKISGTIKGITDDFILIQITKALDRGGKLKADKGINLPQSKLSVSGLTTKDKIDLKFVVQHADVVNMSFVNSAEDVKKLITELKALDAKEALGVILKIETQKGFNQLTEIILEAMQLPSIGVMIARGDLAIEVDWANIGRVQQEILSICEAAHITDVWATQVLESLAKNGIPSRAEITDVIKAQQADCVMLNKGPYILDAIAFLDGILKNMEPYRDKSVRLIPALSEATPE